MVRVAGEEVLQLIALGALVVAGQWLQHGQALQEIAGIRLLQQIHPDLAQLPVLQAGLHHRIRLVAGHLKQAAASPGPCAHLHEAAWLTPAWVLERSLCTAERESCQSGRPSCNVVWKGCSCLLCGRPLTFPSRKRQYLIQILGSPLILVVDVFDGVLHGLLCGSNHSIRRQVDCSTCKAY